MACVMEHNDKNYFLDDCPCCHKDDLNLGTRTETVIDKHGNRTQRNLYAIICNVCGIRTAHNADKFEILRVWNTRPGKKIEDLIREVPSSNIKNPDKSKNQSAISITEII